VTGQEAFLAGHCPLTGRYFELLDEYLLESCDFMIIHSLPRWVSLRISHHLNVFYKYYRRRDLICYEDSTLGKLNMWMRKKRLGKNLNAEFKS
jgi:hypothetical protein